MDAILSEMTRQLPSAVAIIAVVWLFIKNDERKDKAREENARQMSAERREQERANNQMWTNLVTSITAKQDETFKLISDALADHEINSAERYKRIGATQELLKRAAKDHR